MIVTANIKYVVMDDKVLFHHLDIHLSSNLVGNQEFQVLWVLISTLLVLWLGTFLRLKNLTLESMFSSWHM